METVFLVKGSAGEHEGYHEWVVCAHRDEQEARRHAQQAQDAARIIRSQRTAHRVTNCTWLRISNRFDPYMDPEEAGAAYTVETVGVGRPLPYQPYEWEAR